MIKHTRNELDPCDNILEKSFMVSSCLAEPFYTMIKQEDQKRMTNHLEYGILQLIFSTAKLTYSISQLGKPDNLDWTI